MFIELWFQMYGVFGTLGAVDLRHRAHLGHSLLDLKALKFWVDDFHL